MARHISNKIRRNIKKINEFPESVVVTVARQYADGQVVVYRARVIRLADGRVDLEPVGQARPKDHFVPATDEAVPGYPGWFVISGIRVSLLVSVRSCLIRLMQMAPFQDA